MLKYFNKYYQSMSIIRYLLGFGTLALAGFAMCYSLGCSSSAVKPEDEAISDQTTTIEIGLRHEPERAERVKPLMIREEPPEKRETIDNICFSVQPSNPGQKTGIYFSDTTSKATRVAIFEDGSEIPIEGGGNSSSAFVFVEHEEPGTHHYRATFFGSDGTRTSKAYAVNFEGEPKDFLPSARLSCNIPKAGRRASLIVNFNDYGDNAGMDSTDFFEDNVCIRSVGDDLGPVVIPIEHDSPGEHTYFAVVTDHGGQKVSTSPVTVSFTGQFLPPKITHFTARYIPEEDRGRVIVWADDEDNSNSRVDKVVLFQNGTPFHAKTDTWSAMAEFQRSPGTYRIHAEVTGIDGITMSTETKEITFPDK